MIIISICGGLGNQMFEYAFCCMVKHVYPNVKIKLDIMNTLSADHNGYELRRVFGIEEEECTLEELKQLSDIYPVNGPHYKFINFLEKIRNRLIGHRESCLVQRDLTAYEDRFFHLDMSKSYYFFGVFANHQFFDEIEDEIRRVYQFPQITDDSNMRWSDEIITSESVGIHIRHGDYVTWGLELVPEEFYRKAIDYMREHIPYKELKYFVFTDDPVYAKEVYNDIENLYVVEGNVGENSYIDMQLMSLCKHNITANSTFSFWGAYLNQNPSKIVVAPDMPCAGWKEPYVCDEWIKL